MELFYTTNIDDKTAILSEEESFHCIKILRHKGGDKIHFTDGIGGMYEGHIKETGKKEVILSIESTLKDYQKRNYSLHIAIAPTKNTDRIEFFVEKSVEIGIDQITFIKSERSERKDIKLERINKIAVSAMKQSKKAYLPKISGITPFKDFIKHNSGNTNTYIASLEKEGQTLFSALPLNSQYIILIGPEGDFSKPEVNYSLENNFIPISLGESILRTETAGIVTASWINFLNLSKQK